jgi:hypothetical protein
LKKQLIGSGYRVSVANHGQEAFDKVLASESSPKDSIDIILMDVEMPILDVGLSSLIRLINLGASGDSTFEGSRGQGRYPQSYSGHCCIFLAKSGRSLLLGFRERKRGTKEEDV